MSDDPRIGVGCVVVHRGRLLLVRSRRGGLWSTPGGNLDFGESPAEAAVRETREETGVAVRAVEFLTITNDVMENPSRHYVTIWMRATTEDPRVIIADSQEIAEAGWYDPADLPTPRHLYFDNLLGGACMPRVNLREIVSSESGLFPFGGRTRV